MVADSMLAYAAIERMDGQPEDYDTDGNTDWHTSRRGNQWRVSGGGCFLMVVKGTTLILISKQQEKPRFINGFPSEEEAMLAADEASFMYY